MCFCFVGDDVGGDVEIRGVEGEDGLDVGEYEGVEGGFYVVLVGGVVVVGDGVVDCLFGGDGDGCFGGDDVVYGVVD